MAKGDQKKLGHCEGILCVGKEEMDWKGDMPGLLGQMTLSPGHCDQP